HKGSVNAVTLKVADPCTTRILNDDCPDCDEFLAADTLEGDVLEEGHLDTYGSCASIKDQISKLGNQSTGCAIGGTPSTWHNRNSEKKSITSVNLIPKESHKRDKNSLLQCEGIIKSEGTILRPAELEDNTKHTTPEHDESSETISNHSNSEKGTKSLPNYFPLQVLPPPGQQPDLKLPRCPVTSPTKRTSRL
ncbi:Tudor/PWWP/MBT superfamily protein, partial [Zea mays]